MARFYNRNERAGSPDERPCSTEPVQREGLQTLRRVVQRTVSLSAAPTHLARLEVQAGAPVGNVNPSAQPHPALIALACLLAQQAAAELIKISNTALDVDQP